ncbi:armadillo-type protein [Mycena olivaceomarginata]|nr:armadillo-type protein [Mycena olivaceomarginata]
MSRGQLKPQFCQNCQTERNPPRLRRVQSLIHLFFPHIVPMLESPNPDTRKWASMLVGRVASHKSTAPAVLELALCEQLVFLLDDKHSDVIREATAALAHFSQWVDGAKAVVDAKVLNHILRLLKSTNPDIREWASDLVGRVASHESTAPAVLKLNPSVQLVSSLGGEDSLVHWVTFSLSQIARWVGGAKGVVDAKVLDHVLRLLESPNLNIRQWASDLVGQLASHESTAPAVLKLNPSVQLVSLLGGEDSLVHSVIHESSAPAILQLKPIPQLESLLQDPDPLIGDSAIFALEEIRQWPDGVNVVAPTDSDCDGVAYQWNTTSVLAYILDLYI